MSSGRASTVTRSGLIGRRPRASAGPSCGVASGGEPVRRAAGPRPPWRASAPGSSSSEPTAAASAAAVAGRHVQARDAVEHHLGHAARPRRPPRAGPRPRPRRRPCRRARPAMAPRRRSKSVMAPARVGAKAGQLHAVERGGGVPDPVARSRPRAPAASPTMVRRASGRPARNVARRLDQLEHTLARLDLAHEPHALPRGGGAAAAGRLAGRPRRPGTPCAPAPPARPPHGTRRPCGRWPRHGAHGVPVAPGAQRARRLLERVVHQQHRAGPQQAQAGHGALGGQAVQQADVWPRRTAGAASAPA